MVANAHARVLGTHTHRSMHLLLFTFWCGHVHARERIESGLCVCVRAYVLAMCVLQESVRTRARSAVVAYDAVQRRSSAMLLMPESRRRYQA